MAPISPYERWEEIWIDYQTLELSFSTARINLYAIPFDAEPFPLVVQDQYVAWVALVAKIETILIDEHLWSHDIDILEAKDSLKQFKNLLCAPPGLSFMHLCNHRDTTFSRLGPGAPLAELNKAVCSTKFIAYFEFKPMTELKPLLKEYRTLLRKTDPTCKRHYDATLQNKNASLMARVNDLYLRGLKIEKELEKITTDDEPSRNLKEFLTKQREIFSDNETIAREVAHWHFILVHHIHARCHNTEIDPPMTPMQLWTPPGGSTPRALPLDDDSDVEERPDTPPFALEQYELARIPRRPAPPSSTSGLGISMSEGESDTSTSIPVRTEFTLESSSESGPDESEEACPSQRPSRPPSRQGSRFVEHFDD